MVIHTTPRRRVPSPSTLGGAAALALTLILPLAPASAEPAHDLDRTTRAGWSGGATTTVNPLEVEPSSLAAAPKVKGWAKPTVIASTSYAVQSWDVARNAKGQGVVAWSEVRNDAVRPWFRRISPKGKLGPKVRLSGWNAKSTDPGITGQVAATIDRKGHAVVAWTATSGPRTGMKAARITPGNKVRSTWLTTTAPPPQHVRIDGSPNGHVVVWWNGYDPEAWGHPVHYVSWKDKAGWTRVPWTRDAAWMPDEGGDATISTSGQVTATWVERTTSAGRLRAVTYDAQGRSTQQVPATVGNLIMNSAQTATDSGDVTVSFMDATYAGNTRTDIWYTIRRTRGTWGKATVVPKKSPNGYSWDIAGNNSGKVAMIGLGYSAEPQPEWVTVTAGIQAKAGAGWDVRGVHPRVPNAFSFFTPVVHMTANGRTLVSHPARRTNGIAWTQKGKWKRTPVSPHGDFRFASDRKSRVSMVTVAPVRGWSVVLYTKKM